MTRQHDKLIGGQWLAGTGYSPNINPSDLSDVIGDYTQVSAEQLDAAMHAARAGRHRRHHHAVECSDCHSRLENRAGAGLRQLRRDDDDGQVRYRRAAGCL